MRQQRQAVNMIAGFGVTLSVSQILYSAGLKKVFRHNVKKLMQGEIGPLLSSFSEDATLVLDGQHSWSGSHQGKRQIAEFFERFLKERIRGQLHEILVQGPPWKTVAIARFTDGATGLNGETVYRNHAVILARISWGKIVYQHVYEDTQSVADFDEYLASVNPA
ncbi:nuclear transport factor 2 family protein [Streptomyces sp. NBC_01643]|uniref:nuclear transport factor 2 family protein n=1 Tax=Streptomyces sp. NBC_01643 TaxID=2975906 RepID=UPI00386EC2CA|nr:nuclear transport factor 2 family protein [Streptomyces sp. NBC_01643]